MLIIRKAELKDLEAITEIYNQAVEKTNATFDMQAKTVEQQKIWFEDHDHRHAIMVAEQDGLAAGWASLSKWSDRRAYADTAELSLYVKEGCRGKGIGRKLMEEIIREGKKADLHTVISRVVGDNEISIHLHESIGFKHIGVMKEVGRKFGKLLDVYLMQKIL